MASLNDPARILRKRVYVLTAVALPSGIVLAYLNLVALGIALIGIGAFCLAAIVMDILTGDTTP